MSYFESVLAGLVGPVTSWSTDVAPLRTGIVPWSPVIQRGKSRTDEAATPATEFAAFPSEPVARFRPSEPGGKLPKKLLHGPLWLPIEPSELSEPIGSAEPVEPVDPAEPADPLDPADWPWATGTSRVVDITATGTVRRSEVRAELRRIKGML